GGGVGPEQSVGAQLSEALAFEPDHGGDGNVGGGEEDAKPGAGIAVVRPDDVQYQRDKPSVTQARGQQVEQGSPKVNGWAIPGEQRDCRERIGQSRARVGE